MAVQKPARLALQFGKFLGQLPFANATHNVLADALVLGALAHSDNQRINIVLGYSSLNRAINCVINRRLCIVASRKARPSLTSNR